MAGHTKDSGWLLGLPCCACHVLLAYKLPFIIVKDMGLIQPSTCCLIYSCLDKP
jgi:hypothetical protein